MDTEVEEEESVMDVEEGEDEEEEEEIVEDTLIVEETNKKKKRRRKKRNKDDIILTAFKPTDLPKDDNFDSTTVRTFEFKNEGHTLGNSLQYVISNYEDVLFCGYSIPHPSDKVMHLRIQSIPGVPAVDILKRGLQDLSNICDVTTEKFSEAMKQFGNS